MELWTIGGGLLVRLTQHDGVVCGKSPSWWARLVVCHQHSGGNLSSPAGNLPLPRLQHVDTGPVRVNRRYRSADYAGVTSRFASDNLHLYEKTKLGNPVSHRLCYAREEVQLGTNRCSVRNQRIGVDGLVLYFCRQILMCHYDTGRFLYRAKHGVDPRNIQSRNPDDFRQWFQYRGDILTGFIGRLRQAVARTGENAGTHLSHYHPRSGQCPPWLMIACELDIERWFAEDLIDGLMLSPFPLC